MTLSNLQRIADAATQGEWPIKEDTCNGKDEAYCHWHQVGPLHLMGIAPDADGLYTATFNPAMVKRLLAVVAAAQKWHAADTQDEVATLTAELELHAALNAFDGLGPEGEKL